MFLGFVSALVRRKQSDETGVAPAPSVAMPAPMATPDPVYLRRVEELASAIADLQKRVDLGPASAAVPPSEKMGERLEAVNVRIERLEERVEQLASETPPTDHVLAAVEHMIADRIGGLDQRLTDQVRQIELLHRASNQTDMLLQKLIDAVECLAEQSGERAAPGRQDGPEGSAEASGSQPDYPLA
jgi:hypothetical protein